MDKNVVLAFVSHRRRFPSNHRRLPSNRRQLPPNRSRFPLSAIGWSRADVPDHRTLQPFFFLSLKNVLGTSVRQVTRDQKGAGIVLRQTWGAICSYRVLVAAAADITK